MNRDPSPTNGLTDWQRRQLRLMLDTWRAANFDPHIVLGLQRPTSHQQITDAHRRLVIEFHPDRHFNDPLAVELLKRINVARDSLIQQQIPSQPERSAYENPNPYRQDANTYQSNYQRQYHRYDQQQTSTSNQHHHRREQHHEWHSPSNSRDNSSYTSSRETSPVRRIFERFLIIVAIITSVVIAILFFQGLNTSDNSDLLKPVIL